MFPYRVDNPRSTPAIATWTIIALNVLVWVFVEGMGNEVILIGQLCNLGLIPARLFGHVLPGSTIDLGEHVSCVVGSAPAWLTVFSSMFMHGGWFHLIGNMWFLWLFGPNVEDAMGSVRYTFFYLFVGLAAAAGQVLADPDSTLPMVGASGAISGIMGAYMILFPTVRVHVWIFLGVFATRVNVPAYAMLGYWLVLQLLGANVSALGAEGGGVAFVAHASGFIAGALLVLMLRRRALVAAA